MNPMRGADIKKVSDPMNAPGISIPDLSIPAEFQACFTAQRAAFLKAPEPSHVERVADLKALARLIKENQSAIVAAIDADYGGRSEFETIFGEIFASLDGLRDAQKRVGRWMRPRRRSVDQLLYPGASNRLIPQPIGVVGVIVPWNYPIFLSFGPLTGALAAGNRAMVKMSENSQAPGRAPCRDFAEIPARGQACLLCRWGRPGAGVLVAALRPSLLHRVGDDGRAVMANAARNLTPVTLELGGKSPAVVAPDFPIATAAERILWAKTFNAGQTCVAVDYAFLPRGSEDEFVSHCRALFAKRYPDINGPDFTSIIDQRSYDRLTAALDDARAKGARLVNLAEGQTPDKLKRQLAPHIVLNVTPEMELMRREIFGPILPILTYGELQEAVDAINSRDRPLALYPFVRDAETRRFLIAQHPFRRRVGQ